MSKHKKIFICFSLLIVISLIYLLYINLKIDVQKQKLELMIENDKPEVRIEIKNQI